MDGMNCEHRTSATLRRSFPPPGARVVILDPDYRNRSMLGTSVDSATDFAVVVECQTWSDCERALDDMLPELLIARADLVPVRWSQSLNPSSIFPLVIVVGGPAAETGPELRTIGKLSLPLQATSIKESMIRARHEIFRRKTEELSCLLQHYA